jgi:hypothetical protein
MAGSVGHIFEGAFAILFPLAALLFAFFALLVVVFKKAPPPPPPGPKPRRHRPQLPSGEPTKGED